MNTSALLHIILSVAGIAILYTLVHPIYLQSLDINDSIAQVGQAFEEATAANAELQSSMSDYNAISAADKERLNSYLPESIDELKVLSDLLNLANMTGVVIGSYESEAAGDSEVETEYLNAAEREVIDRASEGSKKGLHLKLGVTGDYADAKQFIAFMHLNEYPIIVESIEAGTADVEGEEVQSEVIATETSLSLQLQIPEFSSEDRSSSDPVYDDMDMMMNLEETNTVNY